MPNVSLDPQNAQWMIRRNDGVEFGPFAWENLKVFARERRLGLDSLIRHPEKTNGKWLGLESVETLFELATQAFSDGKVAIPDVIPLNSTTPSESSSKGIWAYRDRCGIRSFLFQSILVGWTALIVGLEIFVLISLMLEREANYDLYEKQRIVGEMASTVWTSFCVWLFLAVPLVFVSIATLNADRGRQS